MAEFDGKVILITGGGTGLGAAIAIGTARRGAKALLLNYSKSRKEAEATAKAVQAAGAEAVLVQGDVSEDADCRKIAAAAEPYGRLDVLVNNAGTTKHAPKHADLDALSKEDFLRIYAINTVAPVPDDPRLPQPAGGLGRRQRADDVLDRRRHRRRLVGGLCRLQGCAQHHDAVAGPRAGAEDPRQRHLPGLHRHALVQATPTTRRRPRSMRDNVRKTTPLQVVSTAEDVADAACS